MTDTDLRFERVRPGAESLLLDWQYVHNLIIPADPLSLADVRERSGRNHLDVAYLGDTLVGCSTVRPPAEDPATATVIARILPDHRGAGLGTRLYEHALAAARALGATTVETVVLGSNPDGLRFAAAHGFTEIERYFLEPGDTVPWHTLSRSIRPGRPHAE
ncbi:GNAT family N-acetyltransferase [Streptomyces sp. NPDC002054]|uniref:GNAT family N-acetyltransferase n=1 Tax=Streptomyces sp. NPDC002054 TaxID=3154663 RepID=UPI00331D7D48